MALVASLLPMFRNKVLVPSSSGKNSKKNAVTGGGMNT
jgi:hypothetical protein